MINQRNDGVFTISPSGNTLDKPVVVELGTMDDSTFPQVHHQTTINNGSQRQHSSKRFKLSHSRRTCSIINPRNILIFCATLSCIGCVIVIYFTLSMDKFDRNHSDSFYMDLP